MNLRAIQRRLKSEVKAVPYDYLLDAGLWVLVAFVALFALTCI